MGFDLDFVLDGKQYKYPLFIINQIGEKSGSAAGYDIHEYDFNNPAFKLSGDIVALDMFLELSTDGSTSKKGTLNNKPISIIWNSSLKQYVITSSVTNRKMYIKPSLTDPITSVSQLSSKAIGYNYYYKMYVRTQGCQGFKPTIDHTQSQIIPEYDSDIVTGNIPPSSPTELQAGIIYQSLSPKSTSTGSEYKNYFYTQSVTDDVETLLFLNDLEIEVPIYPSNPDDPENPDYDPTDPTPGSQDGTSDQIGIPTKPIIDVTNTGFVTLYNPDAIAIRNLAYFMWSGEFVDLIKKMFSAPFDCLIGLKLIYAPITTGASQTIWLGNVESDVSAPKITDQFTDFDCGTLNIDGYFGSFLDYSPYTKVTIFLPFIGYKQLNVDEVMNSQIHLTYRIDAYSGACIAFIHVTKTIGSTTLSSVIYEFDGNCAMDIPFTSGDMSRYVSAILGTAASTAGAVISMGAGAKLATQSIPITANDPWTKNDFSNKQTVTGLSDLGNGSAELVGGKPQIQRGGSLAGANASMALKQPYIIIERPMQQMPADYANFIGIPLNMTKTLSQVTGFTVVSQIFMASSQATDDELNMINTLLRQGVVI